MCTFFSPYYIFVRKISSMQDQISFLFNTDAVIQRLHFKKFEKIGTKLVIQSCNLKSGNWYQFNTVKP